MRRKEGRGGMRDEESEKMKNEKVAKGRIIGLAGPCLLIHHVNYRCESRRLLGRLAAAAAAQSLKINLQSQHCLAILFILYNVRNQHVNNNKYQHK